MICARLPVNSTTYPNGAFQEIGGSWTEAGWAWLAVIGSNGKVSQIRVKQSLNPVLDQKAKAAFSRWKFAPALLGDKPVAMSVIVTVPFLYAPAPH